MVGQDLLTIRSKPDRPDPTQPPPNTLTPNQMNQTEARIQQDIVMWYHNTYPDRRGSLFEVNNNPDSKRDGAIRKAMGMVAGVSDLCLITPMGSVVFVEVKRPDGVQSEAQKKWEQLVTGFGARYEVVRSLADFQQLINQVGD
jgi:hypothetical protein